MGTFDYLHKAQRSWNDVIRAPNSGGPRFPGQRRSSIADVAPGEISDVVVVLEEDLRNRSTFGIHVINSALPPGTSNRVRDLAVSILVAVGALEVTQQPVGGSGLRSTKWRHTGIPSMGWEAAKVAGEVTLAPMLAKLASNRENLCARATAGRKAKRDEEA